MTYKIPFLPSPRAYKEELADFWEILALRQPGQYISGTEVSRIINIASDEIGYEGIESASDQLEAGLEAVFLELQRRKEFSGGKYPFSFKRYSFILNMEDSLYKDVYIFLLLCTRFNMKENKVHNGVDGTLLFEELCAIVASNYFGEASESYVFGTATRGNFEGKVNALIDKIGEGEAFRNLNSNPPTKNDDAVDVVVWKEFSDKRVGKLVAFGQCKTGTSWHDDIQKLKPSDFCTNWFYRPLVIDPLPIVFLCDTLNEDKNFYTSQKGYLVFNRFRILEYIAQNMDDTVQTKINTWLDGAIDTIDVKK